MNIMQEDNGKKGSFYVSDGTKHLGEMGYVWTGADKIIIDHTEVDPSLKGQGVGNQLFEKVISFAREKKLKVLPLCPFAKSIFDKKPEYQDVLF